MKSVMIDGLRLGRGQNEREHWRAADRRKRREKEAVWSYLRSALGLVPPALPLIVVITRVSPGAMDDDGVVGACKYVRDEIARWVGVDDGDPRYTWICKQEKSKGYGVRIELRGVEADTEAVREMMNHVTTCKSCRRDFCRDTEETEWMFCPACRMSPHVARSA